ncbi:MAG: hypothetical protein IJX66_07775 [Lachnospiraceae bacterium]|nr:hypothetical protein [Lachnospiraceae bacterium]
MVKKIYIYEGQEFSSRKALAQYTGIHEKTLTARLRKGMSLEEACKKTDLRCSYHRDGDVEKSIVQICEEQDKDEELIRNRLHYGYSLHDALNKPKKITRQGIPIVVNGILYNSIAAALRKLGLEDKENIVRGRLARGMTPDRAFRFEEEF